MITFICATVFAQMCQDWQWMPRPDMNFLSWGYGFFIISGIASIGAGVCFYLEAKKVGKCFSFETCYYIFKYQRDFKIASVSAVRI